MIGFLHPWVLLGTAAAAVPLLLHLLARREPPTVEFPAVRYLMETARQHQRRLQVQNYLLLVVRTLLILALVLAAAGPLLRVSGGGGHAPSAVVVILDNSLSSGAVLDGVPVLSELQGAASRVLARATPEDAAWLLAADGIPRRGTARELGSAVAVLKPAAGRMDLGTAVSTAAEILGSEARPRQIIVISDFQSSALSAASVATPLLAVRPKGPAPSNVGVVELDPGSQPWTADGGLVRLRLVGPAGRSVPVTLRLSGRPAGQGLATPGTPLALSSSGAPTGWWELQAESEPDELRADDRRIAAVRVLPVARVAWPASEQYVAAAMGALSAGGRIREGGEVSLGTLGPGSSIVEPPADAAALGALNRRLGERGVGWRFGVLHTEPVVSDSGSLVGRVRISRRYALEPAGGSRIGVLATAAGSPWIVRTGRVVLLGSRLDPQWTSLPLSAGFVPLLDALVNRVARGELATIQGSPGDPVYLPDLTTEVRRGERSWPVEGGAAFRPTDLGLYFLLAGRDTVGTLVANPDPRESDLTRASDADLRALWPGVQVVSAPQAGDRAFAGVARADLRGQLLWLAALLGVLEVLLASGRRQRV